MGLAIDSPELAEEVSSLLKRERLPSSYKLRIAADDQHIEWVTGKDAGEVVLGEEPHATSSLDARGTICFNPMAAHTQRQVRALAQTSRGHRPSQRGRG